MPHHVRLIHWHEGEARAKAVELRAVGLRVDAGPVTPQALEALRSHPPDAVIIDLSRLPSQGRDVGIAIRHARATRQIPLIYVGGATAKVTQCRRRLPDAVYTTWDRLPDIIDDAIANPPADPVTPDSIFDGYAGKRLVGKLGVKPNTTLALVGAPPDFERTLGRLPAGVTIRRSARGRADLTLWFVKSRAQLEGRVARLVPAAANGGLWILWAKRRPGAPAGDVTQAIVREVGMAAGMLDFKIASIDATWSGLQFTRRS